MKSKLSSSPWWVWFTAISLALTLITTVMRYLPWAAARWLVYFDLAIEMNLAALWSSLLLLTMALLALENWSSQHTRPAKIAWLLLAFILLLLSWDELGSLHERAGGFSGLLPYIAAFALFLGVSLGILFLDRETRTLSLGLGVMFFLFASVVLQERIEHLIAWPEWSRGLRVGIEEGSELLGIGIGLAFLVRRRRLVLPAPGLAAIVPDLNRIKNLPIWLAGGLALHLVVSILTARNFQPGELGNPAIWLPVVFFYLLFCHAFWRAFWRAQSPVQSPTYSPAHSLAPAPPHTLREQPHPVWLALALYFLFSAVIVVYLVSPRAEVSLINSLGIFSNPNFFWGVQLLVVAVLAPRLFPHKTRQALVILGLIALFLAISAIIGNLVGLFLMAGGIPLALLYSFLFVLIDEPVAQSTAREMPLGGNSLGG